MKTIIKQDQTTIGNANGLYVTKYNQVVFVNQGTVYNHLGDDLTNQFTPSDKCRPLHIEAKFTDLG